jgi:hypothetical protein
VAVDADRRGGPINHRSKKGVDRDTLLRIIFSSAGYDPDNPRGDVSLDIPAWQAGNSMQDLRLSVKGYRFGQEVRDEVIRSRYQASRWLRRELDERCNTCTL